MLIILFEPWEEVLTSYSNMYLGMRKSGQVLHHTAKQYLTRNGHQNFTAYTSAHTFDKVLYFTVKAVLNVLSPNLKLIFFRHRPSRQHLLLVTQGWRITWRKVRFLRPTCLCASTSSPTGGTVLLLSWWQRIWTLRPPVSLRSEFVYKTWRLYHWLPSPLSMSTSQVRYTLILYKLQLIYNWSFFSTHFLTYF